MNRPVHLLGLGAEGIESLSARGRELLRSATLVAGGKRHLALAAPEGVETLTVTSNLDELADRLARRGPDECCVVLASGDPFCYGIGGFLSERLEPGSLVVEPNVSSLQLAFARAGCAWTGAAIASVHGRALGPSLLPLLGRPRIGLFTQDGTSPSDVAGFFLARGLDDYTAWVCEDLGTRDERVTRLDLAELPGRRFGPLNFLVLRRWVEPAEGGPEWRPEVPPDDQFSCPATGPVLLTHADVRAIALSRFRDLPAGPLWDVGAGLGGMAVGLANRFRGVEVVALEPSPERLEHLFANRRRFEAWNLRIVPGCAPEALEGEDAPAGVFLGGSGGRLDAVLDVVLARLRPGGRLVANFVVIENLARCLERVRSAGWAVDVASVQISEGRALAGLTSMVPLRPVWVLSARQPG